MQSKSLSWQIAWDYPAFRVKLLAAVLIMAAILYSFPLFFSIIQPRPGRLVDDWVLDWIPTHDVSTWIFLVLYPASFYFLYRMITNTTLCITALWGYIFLCLARMITIYFIPLEPPATILHLTDPFSIFFYGKEFITKDLFFSGHTATMCLLGMCLEKRIEKQVLFAGTLILGVLLLVQHVHYTMDVIAAPFFSYICWTMGKRMSRL
jgi:hypothetical protein